MRIDVVTIFPEIFVGPLDASLLKRARQSHLIEVKVHDLRSFTTDRHRTVDDRPFGGGAGMVFRPEPLYQAIKHLTRRRLKKSERRVIYLSPQGRVLNQNVARELSRLKHLVLICGHYEGLDERLADYIDEEISIGDYVLTGGELPALVLIDCVARFLPGVVAKEESVINDSFSRGLLDWPHYTRPYLWRGKKVPEILLSGNHKKIEQWRQEQAILATKKKRPDLYKKWKKETEKKNERYHSGRS